MAATKKTAMKATKAKTKAPKKGTVGWLIEQLQKFPANLPVVHGDHDDVFYDPMEVAVELVNEGQIDEEEGEKVVCIKSW